MSNLGKAIVGFIVLVLLVIGLAYLGKASQSGAPATTEAPAPLETGPIKVGMIGPLTGEAAEYGVSVQHGVSLAVDEINRAGGINGRPLEAIYEDGKCNGKDAVSAAQKLIDVDKVKIIIGGTCSGETLAIAPVTSAAKVILFSPVSSAARVATLGNYVFRNHPNDNLAGQQLAEHVARKYKKVAVISEQTDYAQGIRTTFTDAIKANGSLVVFDESYVSGNKDFRSLVSKIKVTGAEALFMSSQSGANAGQIAKQVRDLGLNQIQLFSAYLTGPEFVKSGPAAEGTIIIDVPGLSDGPKGQALISAYMAKYNKEPNYKFFVGTSYDATHILADAIRSQGLDTDKIANYLHSVKDYEGSIGRYSLDPQIPEVVGLGLVFRQVKHGEVVELLP